VVRSSLDSKVLIGGAKVELLPAAATGRRRQHPRALNTGSGNPVARLHAHRPGAGTYKVRATKAGWQTPSTLPSITLDQAQTTAGYGADHAGPGPRVGKGAAADLPLRDDFGGQDARRCSYQPSATFRSAYWLTATATYAIYPDRPAAEFKTREGMFCTVQQPVAFTKTGTPAPNARTPFP